MSDNAWRVRFLPHPKRMVALPGWKVLPRETGPPWLKWLPTLRFEWKKREFRNAPVDPQALTENLEMLLNSLDHEGFEIQEILVMGHHRDTPRTAAARNSQPGQPAYGIDGTLVVARRKPEPPKPENPAAAKQSKPG